MVEKTGHETIVIHDPHGLGAQIATWLSDTQKSAAESRARNKADAVRDADFTLAHLENKFCRAVWEGKSFVTVHDVQPRELEFDDRADVISEADVVAALRFAAAEVYRCLKVAVDSMPANKVRVEIRRSLKHERYMIGLAISAPSAEDTTAA